VVRNSKRNARQRDLPRDHPDRTWSSVIGGPLSRLKRPRDAEELGEKNRLCRQNLLVRGEQDERDRDPQEGKGIWEKDRSDWQPRSGDLSEDLDLDVEEVDLHLCT